MILYFFWRIECERVSATRLHQKLRGGWEQRRRRWSWTFSGARAPPLPSKTRKERACRQKEAISERQERWICYERTELQGSALQWGFEGHGWVLHCSRSGGLSWISQLRSLKRSPFGRWHTTSLVLMPPPHGLVHWGRRKRLRPPHGFNDAETSKICLLLYHSSPNTSRKEETGKCLKEINPSKKEWF